MDLDDNILEKFISGQCSERELAEINSYIQESDDNARKLFSLEELYHLGREDAFVSEKRVSRAERKLFERIEREEKQLNRRLAITKWRKYAAIIIIALLGGIGYLLIPTNSFKDMVVETASGRDVKEIALPDGTKVWLNSGTTIKYLEGLEGKERNIFIEGEAYFEVARDIERPFIVQSDVMQVKVLGTIFNMKSNKSSRISDASLIEGEVEVKGNNNEGMIILSPGQRAELNKTTGRLTVKQVNARLDAVWRNDLIPFDQADLLTITKTLEEFYDVKIILSPNVKLDMTYSGVVKKKNTIESVLNSLKNSIPIKYRIVGNNIFISPAD